MKIWKIIFMVKIEIWLYKDQNNFLILKIVILNKYIVKFIRLLFKKKDNLFVRNS